MNEIWEDINGYEGLYQVSNMGQVKSLARIFFSGKYMQVQQCYSEKIMKPRFYKTGYQYVGLSKDGIVKKYKVHRLVAEAFIDNPKNKPYIDHINTIRDDNRVENLRWVDAFENMNNPLTLKASSISKLGDKNPTKRLRKSILQIDISSNNIIAEFHGINDAAKELNIDCGCISRCCNGKLASYKGFIWKFKNEQSE